MRPDYCPIGNEPCQSLCDEPCSTTSKRKPLTDEQIVPMFRQRQKQQTEGEKDEWYFYAWGVSDGEAAHNIKGEA